MICNICHSPIILAPNRATGSVSPYLKVMHDIDAHASCAEILFYRGNLWARAHYNTVQEFVEAEFWTHLNNCDRADEE